MGASHGHLSRQGGSGASTGSAGEPGVAGGQGAAPQNCHTVTRGAAAWECPCYKNRPKAGSWLPAGIPQGTGRTWEPRERAVPPQGLSRENPRRCKSRGMSLAEPVVPALGVPRERAS